ncbi:hypothetical protein ACFLZ5_07640 [Thermodesulfobacteriota bacterium]
MPKKVIFLLDKSDDEKNTLDAMRSTLGLSVANHYSYAVVLNHTLGKFDDYNAENLEWIRDMEGEVYSTEQANVDTNELTSITLEEVGQKLREMDVIIPYGN